MEAWGCGAAAAVWLGIGLRQHWLIAALPSVLFVLVIRHRWAVLLVAGMVIGGFLGSAADSRAQAVMEASVPAGPVEARAIATTDSLRTRSGLVAVVVPTSLWTDGRWEQWDGPLLLLDDTPPELAAGEPVLVAGSIDADGRRFRGRPVAGVLRARRVERLGPAPNPVMAVGNLLRRHVLGALDEATGSPPGALLAGFLIGDVSRLPDADQDALRFAGLSHFVAVSGSNVALFLAAWWVVGGPLGLGPRRRAVYGLLGIVVFAVVTRWEPSVLRASVMAALVLAGRWLGRPITPWTALGGAAVLCLLVAPELAGSPGFGLSVAATAGIIAGAPIWADRSPRWMWTIFGATVSAQVAVAPLLLMWFGSVPLVAPIANLVAAPIVSASTAVGGVGAMTGITPLVDTGTVLASIVLGIAHIAGDLPQLGAGAVLAGGGLAALSVRAGWLRAPLLFVVVTVVALSVVPERAPGTPTVHFLDVGQGDATLFAGRGGEVILIDGGPDPALLRAHLDRFGVDRIDLLVITHRHADHASGLTELAGRVAVGMVWHAPQQGSEGAFDEVIASLSSAGSVVQVPAPGDVIRVGEFVVEVVGPIRRYAGPNDGSIVLRVVAAGRTVVMSGDIEVSAQADLGPLRGDIMKVPHQGAATSDLDWLAQSAPAVAVISVGPNDYGHPAREVIAVLERAGTTVLRTDRYGSVTLPLDSFLAQATRLASAG